MTYETPEMEVIFLNNGIRTNDIVILSGADKKDNNVDFTGPW